MCIAERHWIPVCYFLLTFSLFAQQQKVEGVKAEDSWRAYADYIQAINLAEEGSKPEALRVLAESLRLQPGGNPASSLAFQLLTELRTNSGLQLQGHTDGINGAVFSPDGNEILTASEDHTARIWDARTGKQLVPPLQHKGEVNMAVFNTDGTRIVTGSDDHTVRVWDAKTGQPVGTPMTVPVSPEFVRFSPDGKIIGVTGENLAYLYSAETGQLIRQIIKYHDDAFSVIFSPDGTQVLTPSGDGCADVWETQTGKKLFRLKHVNNVFTAVYSPDGAEILTASADHSARIWDAKTGKPLGPVFHHGNWIISAAFNAKATQVVTASWDHTARVWDAKAGNAITPPLQHGDAVMGASFNPDGTRVATFSKDRTARIWDAATGEPLTTPLHFQDDVTGIVFSHDGTSVLITSKNRSTLSLDMPPGMDPPAWLADLAEFASTQNRYDQSLAPQLDKIEPLREKLLASTSSDPWEKFGHWYFMESDVRPISPWSTLSLKDYVDGLIALGDKNSVDYAISLSQDHPAWMVRLIPLRAKLKTSAPSPPDGQPPSEDTH